MIEMKLKPCPFCGGEAKIFEEPDDCFVIQCRMCGCGTLHKPKNIAIEKWNQRVFPTTPEIVASLEGLVEKLDSYRIGFEYIMGTRAPAVINNALQNAQALLNSFTRDEQIL